MKRAFVTIGIVVILALTAASVVAVQAQTPEPTTAPAPPKAKPPPVPAPDGAHSHGNAAHAHDFSTEIADAVATAVAGLAPLGHIHPPGEWIHGHDYAATSHAHDFAATLHVHDAHDHAHVHDTVAHVHAEHADAVHGHEYTHLYDHLPTLVSISVDGTDDQVIRGYHMAPGQYTATLTITTDQAIVGNDTVRVRARTESIDGLRRDQYPWGETLSPEVEHSTSAVTNTRTFTVHPISASEYRQSREGELMVLVSVETSISPGRSYVVEWTYTLERLP